MGIIHEKRVKLCPQTKRDHPQGQSLALSIIAGRHRRGYNGLHFIMLARDVVGKLLK